MLENSAIYSFFKLIYFKFLLFYENSFLYRIFNSFFEFCMKIWNGSFVRKILFGDFAAERSFKNGVFGRLLGTISRGLERFTSKINFIVSNSRIVTYPNSVARSLLNISSRGFGIMLFSFGVVETALNLVLSAQKDIVFFAGIVSIIAGIILFILNKTIAGLYNGSFFAKLFGRYFGLEEIKEKDCDSYFPILFAFLGILFGVVGAMTNVLILILAVGGLFGTCLVLYKTEVGIFTTAFCIPILPTKFILGLALLTVASFLIKVFITGKAKIKFNLIDAFILIFGLLLGYSVLIAYFPKNSMIVAATYGLFILFYFAVKNTIDTKEKLYALISVILVSGALVALYGVFQYITGSYIDTEAWLDSEMFEGAAARIYSTLDNPNVLGEYLLFVIPLAFASLYYFKSYFNKLISLGILAVTTLCMILTFSRGAWLGLIAGLVIFIFINDRRLLWLGLIALLAMPFVLPTSIIERFMSIGNMSDGSTSYRVNIWLASLNMIATFWPIGIGLGTENFIYIYRKYSFNAVNAPHSHNLYLQLIIDLGIFGLLTFIGIMCTFYKGILGKIEDSKDKFITAVGGAICAGMTGFLIQGLTDNVWYNYRVVIFFWMMIAFSGAILNMTGYKTKEEQADANS